METNENKDQKEDQHPGCTWASSWQQDTQAPLKDSMEYASGC